jgi:hypothetical protein
MSSKNSVAVKIPKEVYEDIEKVLKIRLNNGLITTSKLRMTEGFRLLRRTAGYQGSLEELKIRPRMEDLKNVYKKKR